MQQAKESAPAMQQAKESAPAAQQAEESAPAAKRRVSVADRMRAAAAEEARKEARWVGWPGVVGHCGCRSAAALCLSAAPLKRTLPLISQTPGVSFLLQPAERRSSSGQCQRRVCRAAAPCQEGLLPERCSPLPAQRC